MFEFTDILRPLSVFGHVIDLPRALFALPHTTQISLVAPSMARSYPGSQWSERTKSSLRPLYIHPHFGTDVGR